MNVFFLNSHLYLKNKTLVPTSFTFSYAQTPEYLTTALFYRTFDQGFPWCSHGQDALSGGK